MKVIPSMGVFSACDAWIWKPCLDKYKPKLLACLFLWHITCKWVIVEYLSGSSCLNVYKTHLPFRFHFHILVVRTRQRGNVGRRGMSSTARTGDWDRGSGGRRGGGAGGVSNGSGRMRRRGGGVGDDAAASFRVPDNDTAHDQRMSIPWNSVAVF